MFTLCDFLPEATNPATEINVFVVPGLAFQQVVKGVGTHAPSGERMCWVNAERMADPSVASKLAGHEIGHVLQLTHLDAFRGTLMFPALSGGGELIPSETLEQLAKA